MRIIYVFLLFVSVIISNTLFFNRIKAGHSKECKKAYLHFLNKYKIKYRPLIHDKYIGEFTANPYQSIKIVDYTGWETVSLITLICPVQKIYSIQLSDEEGKDFLLEYQIQS